VALQPLGIDHLAVACSRDSVGKNSEGDLPSPMIKAAAEKIYRLAKDRGLTIEDLAKRAKKPFQTFINWKKGHTTAKLESLEAFAAVVDATVVLGVRGPGEASGGLAVENPETTMIAQMVDEMPESDRRLWLERIERYANWRRENPLPPPRALPAPRGRSSTS
jgi:transcriptional regulator with XRE-family HTH domain